MSRFNPQPSNEQGQESFAPPSGPGRVAFGSQEQDQEQFQGNQYSNQFGRGPQEQPPYNPEDGPNEENEGMERRPAGFEDGVNGGDGGLEDTYQEDPMMQSQNNQYQGSQGQAVDEDPNMGAEKVGEHPISSQAQFKLLADGGKRANDYRDDSQQQAQGSGYESQQQQQQHPLQNYPHSQQQQQRQQHKAPQTQANLNPHEKNQPVGGKAGNINSNQYPPVSRRGANGAPAQPHAGGNHSAMHHSGMYGSTRNYDKYHHNALFHLSQSAGNGFTRDHMDSFLHLGAYALGALANQHNLAPNAAHPEPY